MAECVIKKYNNCKLDLDISSIKCLQCHQYKMIELTERLDEMVRNMPEYDTSIEENMKIVKTTMVIREDLKIIRHNLNKIKSKG